MWARLLVLTILGALLGIAPASAQKISVGQLKRMVRSSIELQHKDKEVARYIKNVQLTERLEAGVIEDLAGQGAGARTIQALVELREASARLPDAKRLLPVKKATMPPPSPEEQDRIINEVRDYALGYSSQLPDFICTQITRRYGDPSGMEFWQKMDTVTAKVSYFDQKEEYKIVLVNNRPVDMQMDELGGSTSTGEFGTMMNEIFEPSTDASFQWERWGKLRGRLCHVYNYYVRQERSKWSISYEKTQRIIPAYRGLIYVDADTSTVARIVLEAVGIPPSFPVQSAKTILDYDMVDISGIEFMLPLKADMRMRQGRLLIKNDVEFRLYRKFGTESIIKFDTPDELPDTMFAEEPPSQ